MYARILSENDNESHVDAPAKSLPNLDRKRFALLEAWVVQPKDVMTFSLLVTDPSRLNARASCSR